MKKSIYRLSKGFFYGFAACFVFVVIFSILAFAEQQFGWDVPFVALEEGNYAFIRMPLTELSIGFSLKILVLLVLWIGLLFYVAYFYALKEFFKIFIEEKTFSTESLRRLRMFFYLNLIPLAYALVFSAYQIMRDGEFKFEEDQGVAIVHLFIAFLVHLYMDIIKKGSLIQEENDLTI